MNTKPSRGTVNIDPEVLKHAKVYAATQDTSVKNLVETALLAYFLRWPRTGTETIHTARLLSETGRRRLRSTSGSPRSESAPPRKPK